MDLRIDGVQGWSFGVGHDEAALELLLAEIGATTATINDGQPPQFLRITPTDGGVTMAVVNCFGCPATLDTGEDYELLVAVPARRLRALAALRTRLGCPLTEIGRIVPRSAGRPAVLVPDAAWAHRTQGFDHFR